MNRQVSAPLCMETKGSAVRAKHEFAMRVVADDGKNTETFSALCTIC